MALNKDKMYVIAQGFGVVMTKSAADFAQAIYELGVKDERERCALACEQSEIPIDLDVWCSSTKKEMTAITALRLADAIRKGE